MPTFTTTAKAEAVDSAKPAPPASLAHAPTADVTTTPLWAPPAPILAAPPLLMRQEKETATTGEESKGEKVEEAADIGFGSAAVPWYLIRPLILDFPDRWESMAKKGKKELTKDDRALLSNMQVSLFNLIHAAILTDLSSYKPEWGQSLKMAENLSGVGNTYLNLASFVLMRDLEKYISEDVSDEITRNLGWLIIYGLLVQGGLTGLNAALEEELDFTSVLGLATKKWTAAPEGFGRPFQIGNVPDPRWSSYNFASSPTGVSAKLGGYQDPSQPYALDLKLGLNIASLADLYPKEAGEKDKYTGFELYPYFSVHHQWGGSVAEEELDRRWLVGTFIGDKGFYTLIEGGYDTRPDERVAETYMRQALMLRNIGPLNLFQFSHEYSDREQLRTRLNAATEVELLDLDEWKLTVGAAAGVLLPPGAAGATWDAAASASLSYEHDRGGEEPFTSSLSLGTTWRPEDPFDPESARLFSFSGRLNVLDLLMLSAEYHQIDPGPGGQLDPNLPTEDLRLMLSPREGLFRW
ncbi:MAG: hypothetical protein R3272_13100 [Candidatus Promineifilaceae bacterium]|nr:hypothetical protein [Candidatus Promineifilaceae bacterium]